MKKNAKNEAKNQGPTPSRQLALHLAAVVRRNLYDFVIREGVKALDEMLEEDSERLCGPVHGKGSQTLESPVPSYLILNIGWDISEFAHIFC